MEYLTKCSQYHDNWIINRESESSKLVLDGNVDNVENPSIINTWLDSISTFTETLVQKSNYDKTYENGCCYYDGPHSLNY